jgi:hypothetical protein
VGMVRTVDRVNFLNSSPGRVWGPETDCVRCALSELSATEVIQLGIVRISPASRLIGH